MKPSLPIDFNKSKISASLIRAITHPIRLRILEYIDQQKSTPVAPIYQTLQIDQSICSQHLKILRDADLVTYERNGKEKHYVVNYEKVKHISNTLTQLISQ